MKRNVVKIIVIIGIIALLSLIIYIFSPTIKMLVTQEGRLKFQEEINSLGIKGTLLIFALACVKMLFIVLPGEPIEIFYGMCFGSIKGAIYLLIISFITSYIIYTLVNKYQRKILLFFFTEERISKIEKNKLLNNPQKISNILIVLFLLPATPKDFLIYVGALLPIPKWKFILIATVYRFPSFITSTIAGNNITKNNWVVVIMPYVILIILTVIFQKIQNKKYEKELQGVINDIK